MTEAERIREAAKRLDDQPVPTDHRASWDAKHGLLRCQCSSCNAAWDAYIMEVER